MAGGGSPHPRFQIGTRVWLSLDQAPFLVVDIDLVGQTVTIERRDAMKVLTSIVPMGLLVEHRVQPKQ